MQFISGEWIWGKYSCYIVLVKNYLIMSAPPNNDTSYYWPKNAFEFTSFCPEIPTLLNKDYFALLWKSGGNPEEILTKSGGNYGFGYIYWRIHCSILMHISLNFAKLQSSVKKVTTIIRVSAAYFIHLLSLAHTGFLKTK